MIPPQPPPATTAPARRAQPAVYGRYFFTHQSFDAAQALGVPNRPHPQEGYGVWSGKPRRAALTSARLFEGVARIFRHIRTARRGDPPTMAFPRGSALRGR